MAALGPPPGGARTMGHWLKPGCMSYPGSSAARSPGAPQVWAFWSSLG